MRVRRLIASLTPTTITPWTELAPGCSGSPSSAWTEEYWALLDAAAAGVANGEPVLARAIAQRDHRLNVRCVKVTAMVALAVQAELHHLAPPGQAEARQLCLGAVTKVAGLARTFKEYDYESQDPFFGVGGSLLSCGRRLIG